jgi:segregation and condensation protein A
MNKSTEHIEHEDFSTSARMPPGESASAWKGYHVELDQFSGPLDLLLHLVRKHEIDIYDIPIAVITEQYLSYLEGVEQIDLDRAGDFLLIAATLMVMKAKTLLPGIQDEEEGELLAPEEELSLRLIEYQTFKEVSRQLSEAAMNRMKLYTRGDWFEIDEGNGDEEAHAAHSAEVTINEMLRAFSRLIFTLRPVENHHVEISHHTVAEQKSWIRKRLAEEGRLEFISLFRKLISREELVVTFIALLELIHLREAKVTQRGNFKKLMISSVDRKS